ncbi:AGC/PKA protein kinase, variant [Aphanomyces invadans]|uniref:cGMP-dependent protein kinase n=1 Tax=Aphanomyces invadans TaxID=157072 RepID=A0A024UJB5_9STRA|nr:AGC/PKA protein kinase, variant [Aphanomyces invadans]ETW06531.1 AGC/PKA protein kinase, variant [Aphanomyces invadans]|eukprot:XP_008864606.1 AGC/PKA protein kinase, variant [Aphanomyces invadans]
MGCTLCTMTVGEPVAGVPTAASSERQLELERSEARVQRGVTSVTEGVVELMLRGRRQGIFNDDSDDGAAAVDTDDVDVDVPVTLSMEDTLLIVESLRANELFSCLEPSQLNILAKRMTLRRVQGGEFVYSQGDLGDTFYIIKSGHFDVTTNDDRLRALVVGNSFGELGLLYKCIRSDTVGLSDEGGNVGELFCLKGRTFRDIVAKMSTGSINISKDALRRVSLLESLTESQLDTVAEAVRALHFREGDIIVRKGEQGNVLYMIQAGTVVCTDIGALNDIELGDGDYFGERALIKDEPRAATVYAKTDVHVMALDRGVFTTVLGPLHEIIKHNLMMRSVQSIPLLKDLSDVQKQQLIERTPLVPFAPNQAILTEGEVGNDFYIVVSGKVHVTQAAGDRVVHLNTLSCGDYFGEKAALQHVPARRNATVTAATAVECLVVDPTLFQSIREPIQTALESNMDARNQMSQDKIFAASITVASLERIKVLGIGSFGLVYIARHTPSGRFVAVKEMYKARLESSKQMGHVLAEKELLSTFHHPFVLKFLVALQEERKVYIVTESLMGGELFQRIVNAAGVPTPLPMPHARFYAGCVVKALKYLHTRNVAYRDLKPENMYVHGSASRWPRTS